MRPGTLHVHRTPRVRVAADAQLPVAVVAPALDPATGRNNARMRPTRGDGDGGHAWRRRWKGGGEGVKALSGKTQCGRVRQWVSESL